MDLPKINLARCETSAVLASFLSFDMSYKNSLLQFINNFQGLGLIFYVSEAKILGKLEQAFSELF